MKDLKIPLKLISILADGEFHSGEYLGKYFEISRVAINKHMQTIRAWGLDIFTVPGKGYRLAGALNLLNSEHIINLLEDKRVTLLPVIDSTNQYLSDRISQLSSGDACIAEYQRMGRGRRGRKWLSPFGANLYLSMFWRLDQGPAATIGLSLVIGIVMAEVLQRLGAKGVKVKWPNDVYLNDKKLAGILIEVTGKTGDAAQLIIGIGINIAMRETQGSEIDQRWINLQEAGINIDRNELAALLLNELRHALQQFETEGFTPFIVRWNPLDNFMNRSVKLLIGEQPVLGIARGIDHQGALLLEQNGELKSFLGGEISLRGLD